MSRKSPVTRMMDKFDHYKFNVVTYQHIRVPDGWVTQISISKNTDTLEITTLGYDKKLNESVDRAALSMIGKLDSVCLPYFRKPSISNQTRRRS